MAWIEFHQTLINHPKTRRLARRLGTSIPATIGHLACLWCWALEYAQDGCLSSFDREETADAAKWDGDAVAFTEALIEAGFVDPSGDIHDWRDYAGRLVSKREANAQRMKQARAKPVCDERATHVQRTSEHVQNTCAARAGATVPNQTVPNHDHVRPDERTAEVPFEDGPFPQALPDDDVPEDVTPEGVTSILSAPHARRSLEGARKSTASIFTPEYEAFWQAYPRRRRVEKLKCFGVWGRALAAGATVPEIMAGLARWKACEDWTRSDGEFAWMPHRWLLGQNWHDPAPGEVEAVVPQMNLHLPLRERFLLFILPKLTQGDDAYKLASFLERCESVDGVAVDRATIDTVYRTSGLNDALWAAQCEVMKMQKVAANG